jgi:hypothetical protein
MGLKEPTFLTLATTTVKLVVLAAIENKIDGGMTVHPEQDALDIPSSVGKVSAICPAGALLGTPKFKVTEITALLT